MSIMNDKIRVAQYSPEHQLLWDSFVEHSKNGVFLFYRDYMEYHSDRFRDHSLLFFKNGKVIGLLPANIKNDTLYSHEGLTFGGIISGYDMKIPIIMEIFEKLAKHCKEEGVTKIMYKAIPYIYHSIPADEDLYALFRYNAELIGRNVTSSIYVPSKLKFDESRTRAIKKAQKNNLVVRRNYDFRTFMRIVEEVLVERHGVKPVHTPEEIELLASRFPDNIKLFASHKNDAMLAGVILYESRNVAHAQYIANSNEGRDLGALELVFAYLIHDCYKEKRYFDFGISTEKLGQVLNVGLIMHKEGFGARAVMHDFYQLSL